MCFVRSLVESLASTHWNARIKPKALPDIAKCPLEESGRVTFPLRLEILGVWTLEC